MVTDGNGNGKGNDIIVKWVVDLFCGSNGNGTNTHTCNFSVTVAITVHFL